MLLLLVVCILKYIYIHPAQSVRCHLSVCLLLVVVCILKYIYVQPVQSVQCHLSVCFQGSLVLGNQLEAAGVHFPGKHYFSSSHQSLVACSFFYFRLRLHELFPFCMSSSVDTIFVQVIFRQPCWGDFMGVASDTSKRDNLTADFFFLWLLQSCFSVFWNAPWTLGVGIVF